VNDNGPGPEEIGSVAEEAAKLFGALSGWAREHGDDLTHGFTDAAHGVSGVAHNVNEHFATDGPDCTYCPICRGVHFVRSASPEVKAHLATAATSLLQAAAALMATQAQAPAGRRTTGVEHIDLDDDTAWPDDEQDET